jgi:hypothetical protein
VHHLGVQIAFVPRPPCGNHSLSLRDHGAGVGLDVRTLKDRLDEPSLSEPDFALAVEQSVPENGTQQP